MIAAVSDLHALGSELRTATSKPYVINAEKDNNYLNDIRAAIRNKADHPRHHGVEIQAHQIISATGAKESGVGHLLVKGGCSFNRLATLAFIPSALKGACHLVFNRIGVIIFMALRMLHRRHRAFRLP